MSEQWNTVLELPFLNLREAKVRLEALERRRAKPRELGQGMVGGFQARFSTGPASPARHPRRRRRDPDPAGPPPARGSPAAPP